MSLKLSNNNNNMNKHRNKILTVDDEPDNALTIKKGLEHNGFEVDSFTDPILALNNIRNNSSLYDTIILDVKMPNLDGLQLYKEIRDINKGVKVCLFSAVQPNFEEYKKVCKSFDEKYLLKNQCLLVSWLNE
jgi:DNA-binding response OmpR family regulator